MQVGTWNLEYASGRAKNAQRRSIIEAADCDLWILTETHDDIDLSATHEPVHSRQRPQGRPGERWVSIWSRLPVIQRIEVADQERSAAALVMGPLGEMVIYGTVFPWHSDRGSHPPGTPVRSWSEQNKLIPEQAAEWRAIQGRHPDAALIVAGDLNMDLGGPHFYGTAHGRGLLREAMASCDLMCATETHHIPAGLLRHPPIDHILVPTRWADSTQVVAAWEGNVSGARLSDHSGLVVAVSVGA